ncbi:MarR family transcriptional regulator [Amycolatopsis endophytica]|uniref:DNA-binding MarR family transcriptional regulator n=1 Tax=Amycolatopsis endophytica TaxID=860233 RepID=A0A853BE60_9PSEU|nr:MarR family transcriptional regulator [Amycolatopsis endophytica]NYI92877.1 DNA-binding MarR family transcriptional regulator [Amycolatopsis endophytica]
MDDSAETAQAVRWAVSRLAQRLRTQQPGREDALSRLAASVLANLRHSGPLTPTALAGIEGLQPQSLTRTLNALDDAGLVARSRDEQDRRQQTVTITDAGRGALDAHVQDGNAWLADVLRDTLTPAERAVLRVAADLLRQVADRPAPGTTALGATPPH